MKNVFFEELGSTLTRTAKEIGGRAENFYEAQKIKNKINTEKTQAKKAKLEIGNLIYERFLQGEELDDKLAELCQKVQTHEEAAAKYQEDANAAKKGKECPECGKTVAKSVSFCPNCGYAFAKEEAAVVSDDSFVSDVEEEVLAQEEMKEEGQEVQEEQEVQEDTEIEENAEIEENTIEEEIQKTAENEEVENLL